MRKIESEQNKVNLDFKRNLKATNFGIKKKKLIDDDFNPDDVK